MRFARKAYSEQEADVWALGDLRAARIPLLLRQVIDAHLQRLGIEALRLLQVAAVIGHEVPLDVWQAVSETDEYTVLHLMEPAVAARILEERADGRGVRFGTCALSRGVARRHTRRTAASVASANRGRAPGTSDAQSACRRGPSRPGRRPACHCMADACGRRSDAALSRG